MIVNQIFFFHSLSSNTQKNVLILLKQHIGMGFETLPRTQLYNIHLQE